MTPDERARQIVFEWNREYHGWTERDRASLLGMDSYEHEAALIATAIREAIEACAKLVEDAMARNIPEDIIGDLMELPTAIRALAS